MKENEKNVSNKVIINWKKLNKSLSCNTSPFFMSLFYTALLLTLSGFKVILSPQASHHRRKEILLLNQRIPKTKVSIHIPSPAKSIEMKASFKAEPVSVTTSTTGSGGRSSRRTKAHRDANLFIGKSVIAAKIMCVIWRKPQTLKQPWNNVHGVGGLS